MRNNHSVSAPCFVWEKISEAKYAHLSLSDFLTVSVFHILFFLPYPIAFYHDAHQQCANRHYQQLECQQQYWGGEFEKMLVKWTQGTLKIYIRIILQPQKGGFVQMEAQYIMSRKQQQPNNLHSIFRSQIVQNYPPQQPSIMFNNANVFIEDEAFEEIPHQDQHRNRNTIMEDDYLDALMRDAEIVEEYPEPKRRSILGFDNLMASESDGREVPSRNSSLSSKENNLDFHNNSFQKMPTLIKKFSDDFMDMEEPVENQRPHTKYKVPEIPVRLPIKLDKMELPNRDKEKTEKINKIQQVGCNCRKSKCLKMYCECFHLQIFCSQNCNCVGCGNSQPNEGHQQAVIDALTRNPKAFEEEKPVAEKGFTLGVELAEVKKGCKCKKTKCLKKYCECFNSGSKCGIFCKCESCENNN